MILLLKTKILWTKFIKLKCEEDTNKLMKKKKKKKKKKKERERGKKKKDNNIVIVLNWSKNRTKDNHSTK